MALFEVSAAVQAAIDNNMIAAMCWECNKLFAVAASSDDLVDVCHEHAHQHRFTPTTTAIPARAVNHFLLESYYHNELLKQIQREKDAQNR